jgi:hypothetical protein
MMRIFFVESDDVKAPLDTMDHDEQTQNPPYFNMVPDGQKATENGHTHDSGYPQLRRIKPF